MTMSINWHFAIIAIGQKSVLRIITAIFLKVLYLGKGEKENMRERERTKNTPKTNEQSKNSGHHLIKYWKQSGL